jgi:hypothetical protein
MVESDSVYLPLTRQCFNSNSQYPAVSAVDTPPGWKSSLAILLAIAMPLIFLNTTLGMA